MMKLEQFIAWLLTGTLVFVVSGAASFFMAQPSLVNAIALIYYLMAAVIVCPKTSLDPNTRTFFGFLVFFVGVVLGLV